MIAKKEKGKIIKLYVEEANEIESYTLLHLTPEELEHMMFVGNWTPVSDTVLQATYETNDDLDLVWKDIAQKHQLTSTDFRAVNKKFKSYVRGTSCLIRDVVNHEIKIAFRKDNNMDLINRVCIDDARKSLFFRDAKKSTHFANTGKYVIDLNDSELYNYWSAYMNTVYLRHFEGDKK